MSVPASLIPALAVRWVHVVAAAVLLGGAVLTWWSVRESVRVDDPDRLAASLAAARAYEWAFWGAIGAIAATGVGNLGALAPAIPGPETDWGATLALKLGLVLALAVGSVIRTLIVAGTADQREVTGQAAVLRPAYAATAVALLALVGLAEVLAHG